MRCQGSDLIGDKREAGKRRTANLRDAWLRKALTFQGNQGEWESGLIPTPNK